MTPFFASFQTAENLEQYRFLRYASSARYCMQPNSNNPLGMLATKRQTTAPTGWLAMLYMRSCGSILEKNQRQVRVLGLLLCIRETYTL